MRKTVKLICILAAVIFLAQISGFGFAALNGKTVLNSAASAAGDPGSGGGTGSSAVVGDMASAADDMRDVFNESVILYVGSPVAYANGKETRIDTENIEAVPVNISGKTLVPVRFIAESLGGEVTWDEKTLTAGITLGGGTYQFRQGSSTMTADDKEISLGAAVQNIKGKTCAPLEDFAKVIKRSVFYDRGLIVISDGESVPDSERDRALIDEWISKLSYLPVVGSRDKLEELLKETAENYGSGGMVRKGMSSIDEAFTDEAALAGNSKSAAAAQPDAQAENMEKSKQAAAENDSAADDYSSTNVQVQGVDEGDIVKTDGNYIYQVNRKRIVIAEVSRPDNMKVSEVINYTDKDLNPQELYLHENKMVVIGTSWTYDPVYKVKDSANNEKYISPGRAESSVKALIYDIADRENVKLLREVELEGSYISSRKVGSNLYLLANDNINYGSIQEDGADIAPSYRDTAVEQEFNDIDFGSICYFPGTAELNYLITAGIDIDGSEPANVRAYLGAGRNVYASAENLYVAVTNYSEASALSGAMKSGGAANEKNTQIYKFGMKDAKLKYLSKGEVPGTILNQFSMDENGDYFRIATTKGRVGATDESISKNCLYVLDHMLSVTGKIEDMAPGEKIYSVRFMGDRAYVVTFKTIDPLFAVDLKDPAKPVVLGALKIPGYSDYLHPYDENHIIGFGKDTTEIKGQAYYLGMKMALFDVTDVAHPIQKFSEIIGDRGTDSELLSNHKALLFSKEKNLLAFPVTLMESDQSSGKVKENQLEYGQFTFQGALVYNIDITEGFKLKGKITHLSEEDYLKAGNDWYDSDKNIQRILYIGDDLFTLSNGMIKANAIADLKEKGSLSIP